MNTPLGTELAYAYRMTALKEMRDWADKACTILDNAALANANSQDYEDDRNAFGELSQALTRILQA